ERARLTQSDPGGLQQFDNKVALARATAARRDNVGLRIATTWDRKRFPPSDGQVVLETTTAPPPGAWLSLTVDTQMPSPAGPARPSKTQASRVELPEMFFVREPRCRDACDPSGFNPVIFTEQVDAVGLARALSAVDITNSAREQPVAKTSRVIEANRD